MSTFHLYLVLFSVSHLVLFSLTKTKTKIVVKKLNVFVEET